MGWAWNLAKGAWGVSHAVSQASTQAAQSLSQAATLHRASRIAATGVLAPGDPTPPGHGPTDFYDYRGVATRRELGDLDGDFSIGRYLDVRRGVRDEIALPFAVLQRHAAVLGPTGSGKTKSILVPWTAAALRAGHSVVAVDIAGDFLEDLALHRQATGPLNAAVARWDYSDPATSINWNWLGDLQDDSAVNAAVEAILGRTTPNDPQPFFHQRDLRLLRALIELSLASGHAVTAADLLRTVRSETSMISLVAGNTRHPAAQRIPDFLSQATTGRYHEMVSGVINALELWDSPGLVAVTSRRELEIDDVLLRPSLLVVGAPLHGGRTSEVASSLMLSQIINRLYRRFASAAGRHVFLMIDEAGRLTERLRFEELLSVARRARVTVVLATQDVGQFREESERMAILGNCATYVSLPSRSSANAKYLASRLGQRPQSALTVSRSPVTQFGSSGYATSAHIASVPVLGDREMSDPPWGERSAVVHCPVVCGKPFLVELSRPEFQ